jgi:simple sugar transport system permease protein
VRLRVASKHIPLIATAAVTATLYVAGCLAYPNFSSPRVVLALLGDNAFLGVAAVGATFVILSGGIDLSVGSVVAFTSILIATLIERGVDPRLAILAALASGALLGTGMGALIQRYRLPPFLVTLAGMFFARGLGFVVHPQSLGIKHSFYLETVARDLAVPMGSRLHLPFTATCFVLTLVVGIYVAHHTRFGRAVYAIGDDEEAATLMGVPIARTRVLVYTFAGLCSALAGAVFTFYTQAGNPASCVGFELDAIAAVVIGGTLLTGGVGFVGGTAMGVLILGLIQSLITFQGTLNTWWTRIAVGLLLLVFLALQNVVVAASRGRAQQAG